MWKWNAIGERDIDRTNFKNGGNVCYMYLLIGYIRDEEGVKQKKR